MKASLLVVFLTAILLPAQDKATFSPDAEGFIRNWLVLAPIAVQEDSGATEIEKDFLGGEATIKPKADDKVNVDGKILTWKAYQSPEFHVDTPNWFDLRRISKRHSFPVVRRLGQTGCRIANRPPTQTGCCRVFRQTVRTRKSATRSP